MSNQKGVPRRDGSGRGTRANRGRGGCFSTQIFGRNRRQSKGYGFVWLFGIIIILLLVYIAVNV